MESLLCQLDSILSADQLIDELGFLHPSQLASLHDTRLQADHISDALAGSRDDGENQKSPVTPPDAAAFWCADHKLAIAVTALPPLYKAARSAFLAARQSFQYFVESRKSDQLNTPSECVNNGDLLSLEKELMKYTRVLVIINSGYRTAWNVRKQLLKDASNEVLFTELQLSSLALSYDPKCEEAWAHRRWVIVRMDKSSSLGEIPNDVLQGELNLVKMVAERSRMNYRAWRHCCWLVPLMSPLQVLSELQRWKNWANSHVADNCCFHFRRCLLQKILEKSKFPEGKDALEDEISWNEGLIKLYIGREALWVHRRFLFFAWIRDLKPNAYHGGYISSKDAANQCAFENNDYALQQQQFPEHEIQFADTCISTCSGDEIEDAQRHIVFAAAYKLWVLLKLKENNVYDTLVSEMWQKELCGLEQLLRNKGAHQINLWRGLLGRYIGNTDLRASQ